MLKFGAGKCLIGAKAFKIGTVALFNPATQFATGGLGAWYDPSDYTTLSQDSAGTTPVTAAAQSVGRMLDKSGRGNTLLQATSTARPITGTQTAVQYLTFDGVNSALATNTMAFSAGMDYFIAFRRATTAATILANFGTGSFFGVADATASATESSSGTPSYAVNGVAVNSGLLPTRAQLNTAFTVGSWVVVEVINLNLSVGWTLLNMGNFSGFQLNGDMAGIILAPAGNAATRKSNRQFLGAKVGLTLP